MTRPMPQSFEDLASAMQAGFQTSGVTFWDHGVQVADKFEQLVHLIETECVPLQARSNFKCA